MFDQPSKTMKKYHIETWGCQMNVADSEEMISVLEKSSFQKARDEADADYIILNTCHIREKSTQKVLSRLGRLDQLRQSNPKLKIAVAGCVAQAEAKSLLKAKRGIDIILGPSKIAHIAELYQEAHSANKPVSLVGFDKAQKEMKIQNPNLEIKKPVLEGKNSVSRFVNIVQGCNNFCTFCVVPFTRGPEVSKPIEAIKQEVQSFINNGTKEVTLLGQNVNSYGLDLVKNLSLIHI